MCFTLFHTQVSHLANFEPCWIATSGQCKWWLKVSLVPGAKVILLVCDPIRWLHSAYADTMNWSLSRRIWLQKHKIAQDCTRLHTCKSRSSDFIRIPSSLGDSFEAFPCGLLQTNFWPLLRELRTFPCYLVGCHCCAAKQSEGFWRSVHRVHPTKIVRGTISAGVPRVGEKGQEKAQRKGRPTLGRKNQQNIHKYTQVYYSIRTSMSNLRP